MKKVILLVAVLFIPQISVAKTYFHSFITWDGEARTKTECVKNSSTCVGTKTTCAKYASALGAKTCVGWKTVCAKTAKTCTGWATRVSRLRHDSGIEVSHPDEDDLKKYVEEVIKTEAVAIAIGALVPADPATKAKLIAAIRHELYIRLGKDVADKLTVEWADKTGWTDYK